ncbi:transmembrane protein 97 [Prunus yedoensis var. nudiflora]|uniref:Transmembrane protein 97 n=1 Tax=Prunus yedoensis var. nudiflora TaxID=2094558 RepID=A0A314ZDQ0_PRUYE|nr:transmembrane protein 97 [Prunus yedoensis var. nudiflora]
MGALVKTIDAILFVMFAIAAVNAVLIDVQLCLPASFLQARWRSSKTGTSYRVRRLPWQRKASFLRWPHLGGLVFQWPLLVANLYGIWAAKPGAILAELSGSGKASNKMLKLYYLAVGFALLAILRGLLPPPSAITSSTGGRGTTKRVGQPKNKKMI